MDTTCLFDKQTIFGCAPELFCCDAIFQNQVRVPANEIVCDSSLQRHLNNELGIERAATLESRGLMDDACRYVDRPFAFIFRYVRLRTFSHAVIVAAVLAAVGCSVTTQYGLKYLVDTLAGGPAAAARASGWRSCSWSVLIAADNLLWRLAGWIASFTFVRVTGDLRRDLFRHLTGHSPSYFADRLPGMLTSRITATSNAVYTIENMFVWNVLPPCVATLAAIAFVMTVSPLMAAVLAVVGGVVVFGMFRLAAAGRPLHHEFANKAAVVDGEMVDVISNMPLVRAFCSLGHEQRRFDVTIDRELDGAPAQSALSRKAAHPARPDHGGADDWPAGLGDRALAARRNHHRRRGPGMHARTFRPACDAGLGGGAGRRDPAPRPPVGGVGDAAGPA